MSLLLNVTCCAFAWEGSKHVTVILGLFLIWHCKERWAVWCTIVLGFIAAPLLTSVPVQEGDYMVVLEKLTQHVVISCLLGGQMLVPAWSLKSQVRLQVNPQGLMRHKIPFLETLGHYCLVFLAACCILFQSSSRQSTLGDDRKVMEEGLSPSHFYWSGPTH